MMFCAPSVPAEPASTSNSANTDRRTRSTRPITPATPFTTCPLPLTSLRSRGYAHDHSYRGAVSTHCPMYLMVGPAAAGLSLAHSRRHDAALAAPGDDQR